MQGVIQEEHPESTQPVCGDVEALGKYEFKNFYNIGTYAIQGRSSNIEDDVSDLAKNKII